MRNIWKHKILPDTAPANVPHFQYIYQTRNNANAVFIIPEDRFFRRPIIYNYSKVELYRGENKKVGPFLVLFTCSQNSPLGGGREVWRIHTLQARQTLKNNLNRYLNYYFLLKILEKSALGKRGYT